MRRSARECCHESDISVRETARLPCCRQRKWRGDEAGAPYFRHLPADGRRHHLDLRHHAPVLMLENMAMVDELSELGERNIDHQRLRGALPIAPLVDGANPVL